MEEVHIAHAENKIAYAVPLDTSHRIVCTAHNSPEMDLSDLPIEIIEEIAKYLSLDDVCACSQVNTFWKNAFNSNAVWRKFRLYHPRYFRNQESKLGYISGTDSSDFCQVKQDIFKELFVRENMSIGKYHISYISCDSLYCDSMLDTVDQKGNHWLFISCTSGTEVISDHKLQVWKLNKDPIFHTCITTVLEQVTRMYSPEMKLYKDNLILMYEGDAMIYNFCYPRYKLTFMCKISCDMMGIECTRFDSKIIHVNNLIFGFLQTDSHHAQKAPPSCKFWSSEGVCLGSAHDSSFNQYYQLDQELSFYPIIRLKSNELDKIMVHNRYLEEEECMSVIRVFNIVDMKYLLQFHIERPCVFTTEICKNFVIVVYPNTINDHGDYCEGFDMKLGYSVFTITFNEDSLYRLVPNSQSGELIVLECNKFVCVYDITSGKTINSFIIEDKGKLDVSVFKKDLLLLTSIDPRKVSYEVWNYKSGNKLYELNFSDRFDYENSDIDIAISLNREYYAPPKLIVFNNPFITLRNIKGNNITICTFW